MLHRFAPEYAAHRYGLHLLDVLAHPFERAALDRGCGLKIAPSADPLAVGVDACGVRLRLGGLDQHFEELRLRRIVMLPVTEELAERLGKQPVEIAKPVEPFGLHHHAEAFVGEKRPAGFCGLLVVAVDRDDHLEVAERLLLQGSQGVPDLVDAFVDRHSDGYARHAWSSPQIRDAHASAK